MAFQSKNITDIKECRIRHIVSLHKRAKFDYFILNYFKVLRFKWKKNKKIKFG